MFTLKYERSNQIWICSTLSAAFEIVLNMPFKMKWELIDNTSGNVITTYKD